VTGGSGFAGGHVAKALVSRRYAVRVLARGPARAAGLTALGIEVVGGDLGDRSSLDRASAGVDVVFHLAGVCRRAGTRAATYHAINVDGVESVIEAAAAGGASRVVHCSTVDVYGELDHLPANEESAVHPWDAYEISRFEGERAATATASRVGLELVIARPTSVYGPGDRYFLPLFRGVARRRWVTFGSGRVVHHLTYVDDLAEGLRLCGEVPAAAGRTYILGGPESSTLNDLVQLLAREATVGRPRLHLPVWLGRLVAAVGEALNAPLRLDPSINGRRLDFFTRSSAFDITRARVELDYSPRVGLREGVRRSLEWYRGRGWV